MTRGEKQETSGTFKLSSLIRLPPQRRPLLLQILFIMQMYDNSFILCHPKVFNTIKEGEI